MHFSPPFGAVNTPGRQRRSKTRRQPKIRCLRTPQLKATHLPYRPPRTSVPRRRWSGVLSSDGISPFDLVLCWSPVLRVIILSYRANCVKSGPPVPVRWATLLVQTGRETDPCTHRRGPWDLEACERCHDHDQVFHLISIRPPLPRIVTTRCHRKGLYHTYSPAPHVIFFQAFPSTLIISTESDSIDYLGSFPTHNMRDNTSYDLPCGDSRQLIGGS